MRLLKGVVAKVWQLDRLVEGWGGQDKVISESLSETSEPKELRLERIEEETTEECDFVF